jgi:hypothetical protein
VERPKEAVGGKEALARSAEIHNGIRNGSTIPVAHTESGEAGEPLDKRLLLDQEVMERGNAKDARDKLPPPPPLTGANAQPVFAQQNRPQQQQEVHQVAYNNNQPPPPTPVGRNVYQDPDICCVVFVTEPTDRQSVYRRSMEVTR